MKHRFPGAGLALIFALLIALPAVAQERSREHGSNARPAAPSGPSASSSSHSSPSSSGVRTPVPRGESAGAPANGGRDRERGGRGHSGGHSGGGFHGHYPRSFWGFYYGYPYYPYYWWWDGPDYGYPNPYYRSYRGYGGYGQDASGALDLDVAPDKTQVFIDGQYLGTVDDFDGWPQYLWLNRGTYDLVLYLPGFKTVAKQVSIYPGVVIDVNDRLEPGESVRPEDLPTKTHERRDARIEQDRRQEREADRWRDRYGDHRRDREEDMDDDDDDGGAMDADEAAAADGWDDQIRVRLEIEPGDASVYLDGRFIGTANDIERRSSGLFVEPGSHRISVVRPGRRSVERLFQAKAGGDVELDISLQSE